MSNPRADSVPGTKPTEDSKPVPQPDTAKSPGKFTCHSESVENGKTWHYLYNPLEKDPSKAWKKSEVCSQ